MEIVQPKQFSRTKSQETTTIPVAKGHETTYPFQWLLFKPQLHAVEPFEINKASRNVNTARSETRTHADDSKGLLGQ
jgi:hypothetical protein